MKHDISKKLSLLNETVLECWNLSDEKKIVGKLLEAGTTVLNADYGYSWFRENYDPQFRWLYKSAGTPYEPTTPRKRGTMATAFNEKRIKFIENVALSKTVRSDAKKHMKSVVVIPVHYKKISYGTLVLCYKQHHKFTEEEKSLCGYLGNSTAQAITINRLGQNLKKEKQNLEVGVSQRTAELVKTNDLLKQEIAERRKTQRELERSQKFIEQITDVVPGIITVLDQTNGEFLYMNNTVKNIIGYEREEFLYGGTNFLNRLIHPDDLPKLLTKNKAAIKKANLHKNLGEQEPIVSFEYRIRHKRGGWRWVNSYGVVFHRAPDGSVTHVLNISVDVTDRKIIEEKLVEREALLSEAQSVAHIGSWEWDLKTDKVYWSHELGKIFGLHHGFHGNYNDFLNLIHPDDRHLVNEKISRARRTGGGFEFFHNLIRPDNSVRTLHARGSIIFNNGEMVKVIGTGQDVTEQKNAEEKLKAYTKELEKINFHTEEEKAKGEALLSSIGEGIVATDAHGKIILVNPQAQSILGFRAGSVFGKSIFEEQPIYDSEGHLIKIEDRPTYKVLTESKKKLAEGKRIHSFRSSNAFYKRKDGKFIPISITATPVVFKDKVIGVIEVLRDITIEREVDKAKSELISLASHQLRTPLSAINWYSEALLKEEVGSINPDQKKYLSEIAHANQKMVELVYDFLNISRMELGTFNIKLVPSNIVEIAKSVIQESAPIVAQKKIKIVEHYGKNLEHLEVDRKIIRIVLQNLTTNAVKYTKPKGTVEVNIAYKKNGRKGVLVISVKDNGYGIPKDQQDKIFTKLFRADNIRKLDTEGTGLGLYIVKSVLNYTNGKVWFKSKENVGSEFHVSIQANEAKAARRAEVVAK